MAGRGQWMKFMVLAGLLAVPLVWAPAADAKTCQEFGGTIRCQTNGSVSIKTVPTPRAPLATNTNRPRSGIVLSW